MDAAGATVKLEPDPRHTADPNPRKRSFPGPSRYHPLKPAAPLPILHDHRRRLTSLLRDLVRAHNWREASGVLSILLSGIPRTSSAAEDRRNFTVAMELHKRFEVDNYPKAIKKIYEIWMDKLAWTRKDEKKKHEITLELSLFYLSEGNIEAAKDSMRFLVEDPDSANMPMVNLIYGLILYQLWYAHLLNEMKGKDFDISMASEINGMSVNDGNGEPETLESSNDHNAVDTEDIRFSSQCTSESSVGDDKNNFVIKKTAPTKKDVFTHGFSTSRSADVNEDGVAYANPDNNFSERSIFLVHRLDTSLLPIQLKHISGDLVQIICTYRKLGNENYRDAMKHLRFALYSRQPLLAALLPLVQLLLLGDQVEEAIKELEKACDILNMVHPFRLRAMLLEVFHSNQTTMISKCYENVLKRDPTCNYSLEALIRMHKSGNYESILLLEMIAMHLDAVNGNSTIWEEFASCFLKLLAAVVSEYEDCVSTNALKCHIDVSSTTKVPKALTEGHTRASWRIRCRWWARRHFSNIVLLSELKAGDWQLVTSKAACASHLYGPRFEYVIAVLRSLREEGKKDRLAFLYNHTTHSMKLFDDLE